jgi:hypothetical protein
VQDGDKFSRIPEVYIRGNTVKYFRIPPEVIDKVQEDVAAGKYTWICITAEADSISGFL